MLAYYLHNLSPFIWEIRAGFGLRWYGLAYVLAFACGYLLYKWLSERGYSEIAPNKVDGFITAVAIFGVMLGGRLGYFFFYERATLFAHPLIFFQIWKGGMASHGGILGIIVVTFFYSRKYKFSWTGLGDNLCVVAPIGLFFGRIANFVNGELYGRPATVPWAVKFPQEIFESPTLADKVSSAFRTGNLDQLVAQAHRDPSVANQLAEFLTARHPSQIYEALLEGLTLFLILWFLRIKTRQPRGIITGAFFVLYALLRILGEIFREPSDGYIGPMTKGQFLSLFMILIGIAFIIFGKMKPSYERAVLAKAPPKK